jgi:hypothetical protein
VLRRDPLAALTLWVLRAPSPMGPGWFKSAVAQPDLAIHKVRVEHDDELRRLSDTHHLGTRGSRSCIRLMTCACTETSSALTGSSAMTSLGFVASAREADERLLENPSHRMPRIERCISEYVRQIVHRDESLHCAIPD